MVSRIYVVTTFSFGLWRCEKCNSIWIERQDENLTLEQIEDHKNGKLHRSECEGDWKHWIAERKETA